MDAQAEQAAVWNGAGGGSWVQMQSTLDGMFAGIEDLLVDRVAAVQLGVRPVVLDIGCGTGATTLAIARRLGVEARVSGIDLSQQMVDLARQRAADIGSAAKFVVADAQRHPFDTAGADAITSRFGVMFFDDPVQAFTNLLAATRPGGELRAVVWRGTDENPFMTRAEQVAPPLVELPARPVDGPGQFGLADPDRAVEVLQAAGWSQVATEPVDIECAFPASQLDLYLGSMGPLGRALAQHDVQTRARIVEHVRPAFDQFRSGDQVRFTAACWLLAAVAPHSDSAGREGRSA